MLHVILGVCHFLSQTGRIIFELKKKKEKKKENPSVKYSLKARHLLMGKISLQVSMAKTSACTECWAGIGITVFTCL